MLKIILSSITLCLCVGFAFAESDQKEEVQPVFADESDLDTVTDDTVTHEPVR